MISGSFSIIQRMRIAAVMAQGGRPAIEKVFAAPMFSAHHSA